MLTKKHLWKIKHIYLAIRSSRMRGFESTLFRAVLKLGNFFPSLVFPTYSRSLDFGKRLKGSWFRNFFWCHRLDQNSNANIVRISTLKIFTDHIHWCQYIIATSLFLDLKRQFSGGREWGREGCHSH